MDHICSIHILIHAPATHVTAASVTHATALLRLRRLVDENVDAANVIHAPVTHVTAANVTHATAHQRLRRLVDQNVDAAHVILAPATHVNAASVTHATVHHVMIKTRNAVAVEPRRPPFLNLVSS